MLTAIYCLSHACLSNCVFLGRRTLTFLALLISRAPHLCHNFGGLTLSVQSPLSLMRITKADATRSSSLSPTEHLGRMGLGLVILSPSLDIWKAYQVKLVISFSRNLYPKVYNISYVKIFAIILLFNGLCRKWSLKQW